MTLAVKNRRPGATRAPATRSRRALIAGGDSIAFTGWYDDWVLVERERLRQRMLHRLEELRRRLASAGRFADAVEAAIVAIGAEPLRESAQRVLIEAHVAEGNLSEARRIWREYRDLIHRELGVDPSGALLTVLDASGATAGVRYRGAP